MATSPDCVAVESRTGRQRSTLCCWWVLTSQTEDTALRVLILFASLLSVLQKMDRFAPGCMAGYSLFRGLPPPPSLRIGIQLASAY